ncbi:MAG: four helix bundle protein [Vicingaceae bacterium]
MFDFQKLSVYQKALQFNKDIVPILSRLKDRTINDQMKRASLSIVLNISEGTSRLSNRDKRRFLEIARGSAFECVSLLEYLNEKNVVSAEDFSNYYNDLEQISKMLFGMIKKLD